MIRYMKWVALLFVGFVMGFILAIVVIDNINEDVYWEQYKKGLVEGWNNGFESGNQFGQGKIVHYYQIKGFDLPYGRIDNNGNFTELTTWYYRKGYDSLLLQSSDFNPYQFHEVQQ